MSLDVLLAHEALRQAMAELVKMSTPVGGLVLRYVGLFRPAKNAMSADRMAKLIGQLLLDMQSGYINHKGRDWTMPIEAWRTALESMVAGAAAGKLTLPLENHNYLYAVLVGLAERLEKHGQKEEASEQRADKRVAASPAAYNVDRGFSSVADILAAGARARGETS